MARVKRWGCTRCRANGIWVERSRERCEACGGYLAEWLERDGPPSLVLQCPKIGSRPVVPVKIANTDRQPKARKGKRARRGPNRKWQHPLPPNTTELSFDYQEGDGDPT